MALNAAVALEVRTDGDDANGGGFKTGATGVDRSQQAAAHATLTTNSVVHTTTTQINVHAADYTVSAGDVGNLLQINSGTATAGVYEITAADTGNNRWTLDRAAGTAGQTAAGKMGGSYATPGKAASVMTVAGQRTWVKAGTYTITTTTPGAAGPVLLTATSTIMEGYSSTRGDRGGRPVLDAGSQTGVVLFNTNNSMLIAFIHLKADGQSGSGNSGFRCAYVSGRMIDCEAVDCDQSSCYGFSTGHAIECIASNCATGFSAMNSSNSCVAVTCETGFNGYMVVNCLATDCSTVGIFVLAQGYAINSTSDLCGTSGFALANYGAAINCLATNQSGTGDEGFLCSGSYTLLKNCAGYNNTDHVSGTPLVNDGFVSLSADPYVSQATDDFRPNNTAGGGALLRAAGIGAPGQMHNTDIGAVQHSDPASADPGVGNVESGVGYTINDVLKTGTLVLPTEAQVESGVGFGASGTEFTGSFVGGYPYGDSDASQVLTTADGAGTYVPIADSDTVDGGITYGAGEEGTGVNAAAIEAILDARGITTDNIPLIQQPLDATETQAAAAAAIAAAGLAGTGGAYTQTVTVTSDGSTPIPNATVAIYSGSVLIDTKTTNASGIATPTCDAGSYTLRVTAAGYASSSTAITVTADAARAVALAAISITAPTAAGTATGRLDMHLNDTTAGAYESIYVRQTTRRTATGHGDSKEWRELVANALGVIEAAFFQGLTYEAKRGKDGTPVSFTVSASSDTFYLPSVLGEP